LITIDGTDFMINEPSPFDPKWHSFKHRGPGLRYEIGICIQTGDIVWVNGPFPCGAYPDHKIAREEGLEGSLDAGERYLCDGVYRYLPSSVAPTGHHTADDAMKAVARARHEVVNGMFKKFGVLRQRFRHAPEKHGLCMLSVANVTQICFEEERPPFQLNYYDQ
jgi:hypothetical protein